LIRPAGESSRRRSICSSKEEEIQDVDSIGQLNSAVVICIGRLRTARSSSTEKEEIQDVDAIGQLQAAVVIRISPDKLLGTWLGTRTISPTGGNGNIV